MIGEAHHAVSRALSIAGSDSGGGAGIQADLKAFAACGVHGMTAITAITAQNTVGVRSVHAVAPEAILAQVRAVIEDIGVDAVKVGMLGDERTAAAVADALDLLPAGVPVVVDPVMVAESGARLLGDGALAVLVGRILPRATVITPNLPEARVLAAEHRNAGGATAGVEELARVLGEMGPQAVVITGGHRTEAVDLFSDHRGTVEIPGQRHPDGAAHGSGCTHSSALAAFLAQGEDPLEAAVAARELAGRAVLNGLRAIGAGPGPVDALDIRGEGVRTRPGHSRRLP